jgi:hypothetical protein
MKGSQMRINVRITLDDSDLTLEEIAYILAGGDTPVATVADDIETVETVQEEIEIEEPEIVEETVEVVEETPEPEIVEEPEVEPEVEPEEEEQEDIQDEAVPETPQTTPARRPQGRRRTIPPARGPIQRRRDGRTFVRSPQRTSKTEEPQQPAL